jgi:hypothetical protein
MVGSCGINLACVVGELVQWGKRENCVYNAPLLFVCKAMPERNRLYDRESKCVRGSRDDQFKNRKLGGEEDETKRQS